MPHLGLKRRNGNFPGKEGGREEAYLAKDNQKGKGSQGDSALQRREALSGHLEVFQVCVAQGRGIRHHGEPSHSMAAEEALSGWGTRGPPPLPPTPGAIPARPTADQPAACWKYGFLSPIPDPHKVSGLGPGNPHRIMPPRDIRVDQE